MKTMAVILMLLSPNLASEPIGPFVFRVCITRTRSDYTIVSRPVETKAQASMCVALVNCSEADFDILEDAHAPMTHYLSKSKESCK
jgi:hypothetical protein